MRFEFHITHFYKQTTGILALQQEDCLCNSQMREEDKLMCFGTVDFIGQGKTLCPFCLRAFLYCLLIILEINIREQVKYKRMSKKSEGNLILASLGILIMKTTKAYQIKVRSVN